MDNKIRMVHLPAGFGCDEFWMSETLITVGQWNAVMTANPRQGGNDYPVTQVSFDECLKFAKKVGAALPTDARWCRAVGAEPKNLEDYAVFDTDSLAPVKTKLPNEYGLFDMRGLVWEWIARRKYRDGRSQYLRGGAWFNDLILARAVSRSNYPPAGRYNFIGFRLVSVLRPSLNSEFLKVVD